jgi:hypothetical protein
LENEVREISRKMNDVLTRAACDFKDDTRHRQDIAKDIKDEIAVADCRRRVLAVVGHRSRTFNLAWGSLRHALVAGFLVMRLEASTARPHRRIIVATARPLGRDDNANANRLRLRLAMS